MVAQAAQPARAGGFAFSRHQLLRYAAALCGVMALILFYQPWLDASLNVAGDAALNGMELARGDASHRVNTAIFGGRGTTVAPGAAGAVSPGGVTLPTRIPTIAAGGGASSSGFGSTSGATGATTGAAAQPTTAPLSVPGGVVIPTRVPTVAPGGGSGFGTTAGAAAQQTPLATAVGAAAAARPAAAPPAPTVLPTFWFYAIPLAALGLATMPVVWDRFTDQRDRRYGRIWTLLLSYGGALFLGYVLWRVASAPATNALLGQGVGSVRSALPALWGSFAAFLMAAVCLTIVWLMPSPPAPDPYGRPRPA
jgi:hypothetical protein